MIVIIIVSIILLISIFCIKREYISTTFITSLLFATASVFLLMFQDEWEVELNSKTIDIIIIGIVSCFVGELLALLRIRKKKLILNNHKPIGIIFVNRWKVIVFIAFQIITLILYYFEIRRLSGGGTLATMLNVYKTNLYINNSVESRINAIVLQFGKMSYVGTIICAAILLNNVIAGKRIKGYKIYIFPILLFVLQSFISSSRSLMLQVMFALLIGGYFLYKGKYSWKKKIKTSFIVKCIGIVGGALLAFWASKQLVGRLTQEQKFFEYIAYYFAGGIAFFDKYLEKPFSNYAICGQETFLGFFEFVSKIFSVPIAGGMEFRNSGTIHGNTFTAFREFYHDFGMIGVIILEMAYSFIMSKWMCHVKMKIIKRENFFLSLVLLMMFGYVLFYDTIAAQFYRQLLSFGSIIYVMFALILHYFFFKFNIKKGAI